MAEGVELVRTALAAGVVPESLYVAEGSESDPDLGELAARVLELGGRVFVLARGVLERVADTVTPQPVLAVVPMVDVDLASVTSPTLVVVCADVRDPGNAGTILRSADAAGADAVVCAGGTVDPYNPKTVRSSAGSLFHVSLVVRRDAAQTLAELAAAGLRCLGTSAGEGEDYVRVDWRVPTALVLGNESGGLPPEVQASLDATVRIPMAGRAESLNVGVACAVLCFEALRQRRSTMPPVSEDPARAASAS